MSDYSDQHDPSPGFEGSQSVLAGLQVPSVETVEWTRFIKVDQVPELLILLEEFPIIKTSLESLGKRASAGWLSIEEVLKTGLGATKSAAYIESLPGKLDSSGPYLFNDGKPKQDVGPGTSPFKAADEFSSGFSRIVGDFFEGKGKLGLNLAQFCSGLRGLYRERFLGLVRKLSKDSRLGEDEKKAMASVLSWCEQSGSEISAHELGLFLGSRRDELPDSVARLLSSVFSHSASGSGLRLVPGSGGGLDAFCLKLRTLTIDELETRLPMHFSAVVECLANSGSGEAIAIAKFLKSKLITLFGDWATRCERAGFLEMNEDLKSGKSLRPAFYEMSGAKDIVARKDKGLSADDQRELSYMGVALELAVPMALGFAEEAFGGCC